MNTEAETTPGAEAYLDLVKAGPSGVQLVQLQELAEKQVGFEEQVAKAEQYLTMLNGKLKDVAERQLPELMDLVGMKELKTTTGLEITIAETIRASIPKPRTVEAFVWLKMNNHEALIKRVVSVSFGKGEDEAAKTFSEHLKGDLDLEYEDKASVHPSTLSAWVKEKLEKGETIPQDLFGVFRQRVSKIKAA